ncbi:MAG: acyl-CoA thioesterase [Bacillus sp. (in: firmicutes)]
MSRITYIADLEIWSNEFSYYENVTVRFSETDMFGHLNNTVPFTYFEQARINYFAHLDLMQDWINPDGESIIVVADLQCDFLKQVYFNETIRIYVKAQTVGSSSVDLHYMGKNENGEIVFTGRGTIVQISRMTGKALPWSEDVRASLTK